MNAVKMLFSLTNEQRKHLALTLIEETWELVQLNDTIFLYFDDDILRKQIIVKEDYYCEKELNRLTSDSRTILPPLTGKGKPKKLNYTGVDACTPESSYFLWNGKKGDFIVGNHTTQQTYFTTEGSGQKLETWGAVENFVTDWISETTTSDMTEMEQFRTAKRKHQKIKEGDIFVFKIGRREYGFGRVLLDVRELRKDIKSGKISEPHYGLACLMAQPLMVKVYQVISNKNTIDLDELVLQPAFLSQQIMDNRLLYGDYEIVGHRPLLSEDMDFPISINWHVDRSNPNQKEKYVFMQYGLIFLMKPFDEFKAYCEEQKKTGLCIHDAYSVASIGFSLWVMRDIPSMKQAIQTGTFLETSAYGYSTNPSEKPEKIHDLRHPANAEAKKAVFAFFGLDADKKYSENYDTYCVLKRKTV